MNPKYDWAANIFKLKLAEDDVKKSGAEVTEEAVKQAYIKRAGLVYDLSVEVAEPKVEVAPVVRTIRRPIRK